MNIFEQYGIQEVADVTIYSIELDENDDEIYTPIMYLDTLKISTVEGTSEQVSARGGLGNPELITWDYGKEITVTLQDALYTPASQSMTWGGRYGTKKIELRGNFVPYEYTKDKYGRTIYLTSEGENAAYKELTAVPSKIIADNFSAFETQIKDETRYIWDVNVQMVTDNGMYRYYKEKNGDNSVKIRWVNSGVHSTWYFNNSEDRLSFFKQVKDAFGKLHNVPVGIFVLDTNKNINVTPPQEAIYLIKSGLENVYYLDRMEKCRATQTFVINTDNNIKHYNYSLLEKYAHCGLTVYIDPKTMRPFEPNTTEFVRKNGKVVEGNLRVIKQYEIYYKWTRTRAIDYTSLGTRIIVDAEHFPGTYRIVGETYARSRKTGKDHRYQFEIPLAKLSADTNLTLEAGGEPTTFDMKFKVLRKEDGVMMRLTQYEVDNNKYDGYTSDSHYVVPIDGIDPPPTPDPAPTVPVAKMSRTKSIAHSMEMEILSPTGSEDYMLEDTLTASSDYNPNEIDESKIVVGGTEVTTTVTEDSIYYGVAKTDEEGNILNPEELIPSQPPIWTGENVEVTSESTEQRILNPDEYNLVMEQEG